MNFAANKRNESILFSYSYFSKKRIISTLAHVLKS